mmetsp:Transcript_35184/g.35826  ORF Transcript_35184/g.35826 Transcript_35184/m.35826 type:complete len:136 (-) Transcript_35184:107-514(-)
MINNDHDFLVAPHTNNSVTNFSYTHRFCKIASILTIMMIFTLVISGKLDSQIAGVNFLAVGFQSVNMDVESIIDRNLIEDDGISAEMLNDCDWVNCNKHCRPDVFCYEKVWDLNIEVDEVQVSELEWCNKNMYCL